MQTGTAVARNGDALTLGDTLYRSSRTVVRRGLRGGPLQCGNRTIRTIYANGDNAHVRPPRECT